MYTLYKIENAAISRMYDTGGNTGGGKESWKQNLMFPCAGYKSFPERAQE